MKYLFFIEMLPLLVIYVLLLVGAVRLRPAYPRAARLVKTAAFIFLVNFAFKALLMLGQGSQEQDYLSPLRTLVRAGWELSSRIGLIGTVLVMLAVFADRGPEAGEVPVERSMKAANTGALLALLLYLLVPVAAGHGVGTAGLLMVLGRADDWLSGQGWGWLGTFILLASLFMKDRKTFLALLSVGALCLLTSLLSFAVVSDAPYITLGASVPFLAAASVAWVKLYRAFHSFTPG